MNGGEKGWTQRGLARFKVRLRKNLGAQDEEGQNLILPFLLCLQP